MSWSDDTRCLHCDGRLPLYRKITHGQFCSSAHRKAYWQDQERLAIERLSQTHNSLKAFRLAGVTSVESLVEAAVEAPLVELAPGEAGDPGFARLMPETVIPSVVVFPGVLAADPLEYEIFSQPRRPSRPPTVIEMRPLGLASLIRGWADFSACRWTGQLALTEIAPSTWGVSLRHPNLQLVLGEALFGAGQVGLPLLLRAVNGRPGLAGGPIESMLRPVTNLRMEVPPTQSDVLAQLLDEQAPRPDRLFSLAFVTPRQGGGWMLQRVEFVQPIVAQTHALVVRGETILHFTPVTLVLADSAMLGLPSVQPVKSSAVVRGIFPVDARALELRCEGSATKIFSGATPRDPSLGFASSQLSFPTPPLGMRAVGNRPHAKFSLPAIAIPERRVSTTPIAGVLPQFTSLAALPYGESEPLCGAVAGPLPPTHLFPQPPSTQPLIPKLRLEPIDAKPEQDFLPSSESGVGVPLPPPARPHQPIWSHATDFWQHAPRDLKLLLFAIPALIALVFHPSLPKVSLAAPQTASNAPSEFKKVLNDQWSNVRQTVLDRAAIALNEDFRSGLDDWASPGGSTTSWSFDQTGFVRPGPLAIYRPSVGLTDYQVQFLGLIDKKAMSWVVRAADFDNYYVIKMTVLKPGPVPLLGIVRYAVVNGKAQNRVDTPVPINARPDMLYRVLVDIHGDTFSLAVQGQMVDTWSEPRLAQGGVGFFSARGEESRVRWVQVTHQYDMLGRLCAYLAPYNIPSTNGSWQP